MLLWWVSRGTGLAALVALTAGLALGVATVPGVSRPRFVAAGLHRTLSTAGLALVAAHVVSVVLDGYAPVGWLDSVAPFLSPYRRVWTGLGTLGFDVMLVAAATSWRPLRPAYRTWKVLHVLSWVCWPVAVAHGVADGTDTRAVWALGLTALCVAVLAGSLGYRVSRRPGAVAAAVVGVALLVGLASAGPLGQGWAASAGTPARLVGGRPATLPRGVFRVAGAVDERLETGTATQRAREVLTAALPAGRSLQVVLEGEAFETGLNLAASRVSVLGATGAPLAVGAVIEVTADGYRVSLGSRTGVLAVHISGVTAWNGTLTIS